MEWSTQQQHAINRTGAWLKEWNSGNHDQQIFKLFGLAGTGKSTLAKHLAEGIDGDVLYGAYTGKAALVMRKKGNPGASTIHSMVYRPQPFNDVEYGKLKKARNVAIELKDNKMANSILRAMKEMAQPKFVINEDSKLVDASLCILDECSMIDDNMAEDLLSFDVPLLVLGDPGQLPPIKGEGALTRGTPDISLTQIHRQALDNPIIRLAMDARAGRKLGFGEYGTSLVVSQKSLTKKMALVCDQILVGKNRTRLELNRKIRGHLGHLDSGPYPQPGEKVICLRNDRQRGIFNGSMGIVDECEMGKTALNMTFHSTDEDEKKEMCKECHGYSMEEEPCIVCNGIGTILAEPKPIHVEPHPAYFDEYATPGTLKPLTYQDFKHYSEFDFGYAITVHKSQGSQWDHVLLYDDKFFVWDQDQRPRWLYTAITRAAERITIAQ